MGELTPAAEGPRPSPIAYEHHPELASTIELRQLQYAEDDGAGSTGAHAALFCVERDPEACAAR